MNPIETIDDIRALVAKTAATTWREWHTCPRRRLLHRAALKGAYNQCLQLLQNLDQPQKAPQQ